MPFDHGSKVEGTDNLVKAGYDQGAISRKAADALGPGAPAGLADRTARNLSAALTARQSMGVCLAMSCLWLERVLTSQNPWLPKLTDLRSSALATDLQTAYQTKSITTAIKQIGAGQAVDLDAAERSAFESWARKRFGLVVAANGTVSGTFSDAKSPGTVDARSAAGFRQTIENLMQQDRAGFLISIALVGGSHAMAMYVHGHEIYVLDPNLGVYRYKDRLTAAQDIRKLFRAAPGSAGGAPYAGVAGKDWTITQMRRI